MAEDYGSCENQEYVGSFVYYKLRAKGKRQPRSRYTAERERIVTDGSVEYTVAEIKGSRMFEGIYQYEVCYEGYEGTYWKNADSLQCFDMMDEFELSR